MSTGKTFKIGDRVRYLEGKVNDTFGRLGTISGLDDPFLEGFVQVRWDIQDGKRGDGGYYAKNLELVPFEVGDRVTFTREAEGYTPYGLTGTIQKIEPGRYLVSFDGWTNGYQAGDRSLWYCVADELAPLPKVTDPQAKGFDYGQPFATTHSLLFGSLEVTSKRLDEEANAASIKAWELTGLLRNVRIATTADQYIAAENALRDWAKANDAQLGATGAGSIDFDDYDDDGIF